MDVQSDLLRRLPTRLVVPLAPLQASAPGLPKRMAPRLRLAGRELVLVPHEAGAVQAKVLRKRVATLRAQARLIVDALDALVSGV